jgi:hypothetical protein
MSSSTKPLALFLTFTLFILAISAKAINTQTAKLDRFVEDVITVETMWVRGDDKIGKDGPVWTREEEKIDTDGPVWARDEEMTGTDGPVWARAEEKIGTDGPVWARVEEKVGTDGPFWARP